MYQSMVIVIPLFLVSTVENWWLPRDSISALLGPTPNTYQLKFKPLGSLAH